MSSEQMIQMIHKIHARLVISLRLLRLSACLPPEIDVLPIAC